MAPVVLRPSTVTVRCAALTVPGTSSVWERPLDEIISQLITASIPLWELTLAPLVQGNGSMQIPYTGCRYHDIDPGEQPEAADPQQESDNAVDCDSS